MKESINRQIFFRRLAVILFFIVLVLRLFQLFTPDKKYSETENRNLQARPEASLMRIVSGRYSTAMETYVSDQFPFRTAWVQLKGLSDRLMGRTESNNIFLSDRGYLIENFTSPDRKVCQDRLKKLKQFVQSQKKLKQYMLIAPTAVSIYRELLPEFAPAGDQDAFLDQLKTDAEDAGITFMDVRDAFRSAEETQLYYKTDHHWTTDGAYLAYRQFTQAAGLKESAVLYQRMLVTDSFRGTMSASSGFRMWEKEKMYIYLPEKGGVEYAVNYVSEGLKSASFYETDKLNVRDKYAVFLGGNHSLVKITTTAGSGKVLLLLKDSYANCFVPFLAEHYDKILMVDPRYYYDDLKQLISSEKVTDVLYLYNANGFSQDTSLADVLENAAGEASEK